MDMLEHKFFNNGMDGYVELCKDLCGKFMWSFDEFEKYNSYLDFWDLMKWLDNIVILNTTNVVKETFEVGRSTPRLLTLGTLGEYKLSYFVQHFFWLEE